jgi:hypothetical protein
MPGEHPQCGGLAAAARAEEDEELAVAHREIEVVHGFAFGARICTTGLDEFDCRHAITWSTGLCRPFTRPVVADVTRVAPRWQYPVKIVDSGE